MSRNPEGTMYQPGLQGVQCALEAPQSGGITTTVDGNGENFVMTDISNNRSTVNKQPEDHEFDIAGIIKILCSDDNNEYNEVQRNENQTNVVQANTDHLNPKPDIAKKKAVKKRAVKKRPSVRKRQRNPEKWQKNESKKCRNSGLSYVSKKTVIKSDGTKECTKVIREARKLLPACDAAKCRLKCSKKFTEESRQEIFDKYWSKADLLKQRMFVLSCLSTIKPKYRYAINEENRSLNNAFHFTVGREKIRVCKQFFINTLGINNRVIRTVLAKRDDLVEGINSEKRGKHKKNVSNLTPEQPKTDKEAEDKIDGGGGSCSIKDLSTENAQPSEETATTTNCKIYHSIFGSEDASKQDKKKNNGKSRKSNPEKWIRNEAKKCRNSGLSYISKKTVIKSDGTKECTVVVRDARKLLPACIATKCRLKCAKKFTEKTRQEIFDKYWSKADLLRQRMFVLSCISTVIPKYRYAINEDHRSLNNAFHFTVNDERIRVCKKFFLNTLGITDRVIRTVLVKRDDLLEGNFEAAEKRGKHKNRGSNSQKEKAKIE